MARAQVAAGGPIARYIEEVRPDLYGSFWTRRRIEAEFADHLAEAVQQLLRRGLTRIEAERQAVERFGSPDVVARTFARSKGVGVPTRFTRWSGIALIVSVIVLTAAFAYSNYSESFSHGAFADIATPAAILFAVGMFGVYVRTRGQLGRWGRLGFRLIFLGFFTSLISSFFWFAPGGVLGLVVSVVGVAWYFGAMLKTDVWPRAPLVMMMSGLVGVLVVGVGGFALDIDTSHFVGPIQFGLIGGGLCWLGAHMWSEDALDGSEETPRLAT